MVEPLTDEWLRQLEAATSSIVTDPSVSLVIQQTVIGDVVLQWHVAIAKGSANTHVGPAADPDITLQTDHDTAVGIATGRISAQRAFLEGALRIAGRIDVLIEARDVLERIGDSLWQIRETSSVSDPAET